MSKLLILGAGQYGKAVKDIAETVGVYDIIQFLDDNSEFAVGKLSDVSNISYDAAIVAIGNPAVRKLFLEKISNPCSIVHTKAYIAPSAKLGKGVIIEAGAVISSNAIIGDGTIVMANAVVGHDAVVGNYCQLKYNCTVPERCVVPDMTKIDCNVVYHN